MRDGLKCLDAVLAAAGRAARLHGPPVVAASSIGAWSWCPLKAWHNTSLFNSGWLPFSLVEADDAVAGGLAALWAAELAKKSMYRIIHGKILHGDTVEPGEAVEAARLAEELARRGARGLRELLRRRMLPGLGLIDPEAFERQLARYREAEDIVEYSKLEEWPLIARRGRGVYVIGVPDRVEYNRDGGGVRVVELKTTSRPRLFRRRSGRGYRAAVSQLAAYSWILVERWPLEEAVLLVEDAAGDRVMVERFDPEELAALFEEELLPIAERLAAPTPPRPRSRSPCRSCEYGGSYPH